MEVETTTNSVTKCIPLTLEAGSEKKQIVQDFIDEAREIRNTVQNYIPTHEPHEWDPMNSQIDRHFQREFPQGETTHLRNSLSANIDDVVAMFVSWRERGMDGDRPSDIDGNYASIVSHRTSSKPYIEVAENNTGYGVKLRFEPYKDGIWFAAKTNEYVNEYLERIVDDEDDLRIGDSEVWLDNGELRLHLSVVDEVETYEPESVERTMGVDVNVDPLVVCSVLDADGTVETVEMERGKEFRHHREELKKKKEQSQRDRSKHTVLWHRYTEQIADVASRRAVDVAAEHAPIVIRMEDLTNYRRDAEDPIHDWPFAMIQEKIQYKAEEKGIPVETIDPRNTSITCRKCETTNPSFRNNRDFVCSNCEYEVHADVNASFNIATGGVV